MRLEYTLSKTPYGVRKYAHLWQSQIVMIAKKKRHLLDLALEKQVEEDNRFFSIRPFPHKLPVKPTQQCDCTYVPRPCPFVSCRYNTYLDVSESGEIIQNWNGLEPDQVPAHLSCVLDIADEGGVEEGVIAEVLGLTVKQVAEVYEGALKKLRHYDVADKLRVFKWV